MSKLSFWIKNARSIALPQSVLPCLTAIILCIGQDGFLWWLSFPIFFGICAAHLGMNLADDYFDFKHDSRTRADISSCLLLSDLISTVIFLLGSSTTDLPNPVIDKIITIFAYFLQIYDLSGKKH